MKRPLMGLLTGLGLCLLLTTAAGENPQHILKIFFNSAFGSSYDFGLTLFYTTTFIFTGLSVALAFHVGLFNIGAEGQLTVATMATSLVGILLPPLPGMLSAGIAVAAGMLAGGAWAMIPAILKIWRGSHEVVITMMMNFIAAGLTSYLVVHHFQNPDSQNPETAPVNPDYLLKPYDFVATLFADSPANLSFVVAIVSCLILAFVLSRTRWGFELKAVGQNEIASEFSGINAQKTKFWAMTISGMIAGLVAMNEVLGSAQKFRIGFSAEYGFVGIAVALLARNNPLGIIASAFLFGILQKGTADMDIETETITRDFSKIMQAIIILSVTAAHFWPKRFWRLRGLFRRQRGLR